MPIPDPMNEEAQDEFISRCMSDLNEEFPDEEQRSAVCHAKWDEVHASVHDDEKEDEEEKKEELVAGGIVLTAPLAIYATATDGSKPAQFTMKAYNGGSFGQVWASTPIVVDLDSLVVPTAKLPVHRDHDSQKVVGHITAISNTRKQLFASGVISAENDHAREVVLAAKNGFPWQASIGTDPHYKMDYVSEGKKVEVNGRVVQGPVAVARNAVLREISITSVGADSGTTTTIEARAKMSKEKESAPSQVDDAVNADLTRMAEVYRLKAAVDKHLGNQPDLAIKAIEERWSEDRMQLEAIRCERQKAPAAHISSGAPRNDPEFYAAAMWKAAGRDLTRAGFSTQAIEAASKYAPKSAGLKWMLHESIRAAGDYVHAGVCDDSTVRQAIAAQRKIEAQGFSNVVLTNILANVANKAMLAAYENPEAVAEKICAVVEHADFKQHSRMRMLGGGNLVEIPPGGEIPHGELDEEVYNHTLQTRGLILALTRQDIINDDLQALVDLGTNLGTTAVRSREKRVFDILQDNSDSFFQTSPTFATAGYRSNQMSGVLSPGNLISAEQKFWLQTDKLNNPIMVSPKILLVPPQLGHDAKVLTQMRTVNVRSGTTTLQKTSTSDASTFVDQLRVDSEYQGAFTVYVSPWLTTQANPTNGDNDAWYLFADPAELAAMELAYLRGARAPTVENSETEFNTLGIQWRIYWDFNAVHRNPRAAVRSTGT